MKTSFEMAEYALERRDEWNRKCSRRKRQAALWTAVLMLLLLPVSAGVKGAAQTEKEAAERSLRFDYAAAEQTEGEIAAAEKYRISVQPSVSDAVQDVCLPYLGAAAEMWPGLEKLWYGRCFSAVELTGLTLTEGSGSVLYWDAERKTILADSAFYCWSSGSYFDGSPLAACDGGAIITLTAAKSGILRCGLWMPQEQAFGWNDRDITLRVYEDEVGYSYDENGVPQQRYTRYRAWFMMDGIEFEIVGEAVDKELFESCVRQVMWGK